VYGPVLKTTQLSAHAQNHASPKRCRKSFTIIFLGDHDIPLIGSNFWQFLYNETLQQTFRPLLSKSSKRRHI